MEVPLWFILYFRRFAGEEDITYLIDIHKEGA